MSQIKLENEAVKTIEADNLYDMLYDAEGNQRVNSDKVVLKGFNMLENPPFIV